MGGRGARGQDTAPSLFHPTPPGSRLEGKQRSLKDPKANSSVKWQGLMFLLIHKSPNHVLPGNHYGRLNSSHTSCQKWPATQILSCSFAMERGDAVWGDADWLSSLLLWTWEAILLFCLSSLLLQCPHHFVSTRTISRCRRWPDTLVSSESRATAIKTTLPFNILKMWVPSQNSQRFHSQKASFQSPFMSHQMTILQQDKQHPKYTRWWHTQS